MATVTLTMVIGLTLRVLVPLFVMLGLGTLVHTLVERRQEAKS